MLSGHCDVFNHPKMRIGKAARSGSAKYLLLAILALGVTPNFTLYAQSMPQQSSTSASSSDGRKAYEAWQQADDAVPGLDCGSGCENIHIASGFPAGVWAATALDGDDDDMRLGSVMVALVQQQGKAFKVLATGRAPGPLSVGGRNGENISANIDGSAYPISARDAAFGVVVHEGYSTESINTDHATLYLFLRHGDELRAIFQTIVVDRSEDLIESDAKSDPEGNYENDWIVRFSKHQTEGKYDLILSRRGYRTGRIYVWKNGQYSTR